MSVAILTPPEQGQMVSVRARPWMVTDVSASTLPPERLHNGLETPQHLISLSSVEDDGLSKELTVIWELEPGARIVEKVALPDPTGFDPDRLDAFLDAVRWGASSSAEVRTIQSPSAAASPSRTTSWTLWCGPDATGQPAHCIRHHTRKKLIVFE
jgi:hypothetical protein